LPATATIKSLCVALPGFVTLDGILLRAPHLGWRDLRVREQLKKLFRWPVFVENDANLAAFGKWHLNREFRDRHIALLSMTDGVGCGFVAGGRIARGAHGLSGELGIRSSGAGQRLYAAHRTPDFSAPVDRRRRRRRPDRRRRCHCVGRWMAYGLLEVTYSHDPDDTIIAGEMPPFLPPAGAWSSTPSARS
jgi:hypothetical protein